jgi:hypothetical protein
VNTQSIINLRLASQHIAGTRFTSPKDLVSWMGAMQAQDYAMSKWAVGVRLPNSTAKSVEAAMDKGDIIRTHVLRPTWHLIAAGVGVGWLVRSVWVRVEKLISGNKIQTSGV